MKIESKLNNFLSHYNDVIMTAMVSQITSLTIIYSSVYSGADKKNTSKLRVTGLCEENSPVTGEFPTQRASNAENVSIWWRHHEYRPFCSGKQGVVSIQRCHLASVGIPVISITSYLSNGSPCTWEHDFYLEAAPNHLALSCMYKTK